MNLIHRIQARHPAVLRGEPRTDIIGQNPFGSVPQLQMVLTEGGGSAISIDTQIFAREILSAVVPRSAQLISLDGVDGVGKSTLGRALASEIGAKFVDLDDFLEKHEDRYLSSLHFDELQPAMNQGGVVLAGCLIEAVLSRLDRQSDFRIYVARTARMRSQPEMEWIDERDLLCGETPAEDLIAELEESARRWAQGPSPFGGGDGSIPEFQKELIRYHRDFAPHKRADIIVRVARMNS